MNEKSLQKNLANLERELVNLQTAHEVGIGAVRFYEYGEYTEHYFLIGDINVVVVMFEAAEGENQNPMLQSYCDMIGLEIVKSSTLPNRYVIYMVYYQRWGHGLIWQIVSSSRLDWSYADSWQEAEDWLGEPL